MMALQPWLQTSILEGKWQSQTVALLDVHVVDTDPPSRMHRNTMEEEKYQ